MSTPSLSGCRSSPRCHRPATASRSTHARSERGTQQRPVRDDFEPGTVMVTSSSASPGTIARRRSLESMHGGDESRRASSPPRNRSPAGGVDDHDEDALVAPGRGAIAISAIEHRVRSRASSPRPALRSGRESRQDLDHVAGRATRLGRFARAEARPLEASEQRGAITTVDDIGTIASPR